MENTKKNSLGNKVISPNQTVSWGGRAPGYITFFRNGSGWCVRYDKNAKQQATSVKHQAPIFRKRQATSSQASSDKRQALSCKHQASSRKQQALQFVYPHKVSSS